MSLCIEFDGLWDVETKACVESALRACIVDPPVDEVWSVSVTSFSE